MVALALTVIQRYLLTVVYSGLMTAVATLVELHPW